MENESEYTTFISADALDVALAEQDMNHLKADDVVTDKHLREHKITTEEILVDFKTLRQERDMENFTLEIEKQGKNRERVRDVEVTETEAEEALPDTAEIALIKKEQRRAKTLKKRILLFCVLLLFVSLLPLSTYYAFFRLSTVDIFKQVNIRAEGVNGKGILVIDPKIINEKIDRVVKELTFSYSKTDGTLSNGDVVTITIDEQQPILKTARIIPAKRIHKYVVTGLVSIPQRYIEIVNPEILLNDANKQIERDVIKYRTALIAMAKEEYDADIEFNIRYELLNTWYAVDNFSTSCTTNEKKETCASVTFMYQIHAEADSDRYYLLDPDDYLIVEYSGIHYDQNNNLKYKLVDMHTFETEEQASQKLLDIGFSLVLPTDTFDE